MLSVENYTVKFKRYTSGLKKENVVALNGLDITVAKGELVSVIGASGSGKSILAGAIMGLLPQNASVSGEINFKGEALTPSRIALLRGKKIALIPQPVTALDPLMTVGKQVARSSILNGSIRRFAIEKVNETFNRYDLPAETTGLFPFQLSGGMARRVLLSTAVATQAELLIADEPTPGLHKDSVRRVLKDLRSLADSGKGVLLITHDLEEAVRVSDTVVVVYKGKTVEIAMANQFCQTPVKACHPYSKALWNSLPQNGFKPLPGLLNTNYIPDAGCHYEIHCPDRDDGCKTKNPGLLKSETGLVRCHHA